jgi:hypothetical protein
MRCVFANPGRNFAPHLDVISRHLGDWGYASAMRLMMALLCSFLLLATLFGQAHSERSLHGAHADALHAQPLLPDALCGEGSICTTSSGRSDLFLPVTGANLWRAAFAPSRAFMTSRLSIASSRR